MENKTKLKVALTLKNNDYVKVELDSLEITKSGLSLYFKGGSLDCNLGDIELMAICVDDSTDEQLVFRTTREPKVRREE